MKTATQSVVTDEMRKTIDRMDEIANVWEMVTDLLNPGDDLRIVDRDKMACALGFLQREYNQAREAFSKATYEAIGSSI